jgi:hypothetical protein
MPTLNTTTREDFRTALRNAGLKKVEDDILSKGTVALCESSSLIVTFVCQPVYILTCWYTTGVYKMFNNGYIRSLIKSHASLLSLYRTCIYTYMYILVLIYMQQ